MTAQQLIDLLRQHPKACAALGIEIHPACPQMKPEHTGIPWCYAENARCERDDIYLFDFDYSTCGEAVGDFTGRFRRWLLGAAQEWADEHNIEVGWASAMNEWQWCRDGVAYWGHPTRLHALLAAIDEAQP